MANIRKTFNFRNGVQVDEDNFIVDSLGKVGIGTTVPNEFIDCRGNAKVVGILTSQSLETRNVNVAGVTTFSGTVHVGAAITIYPASGIISATSIRGDGRNLINIPTSQWTDLNSGLGHTSIYNEGFVGVSTNDPRFTLQVGGNNDLTTFANGVGINSSGNIVATGVVTATTFKGDYLGSLVDVDIVDAEGLVVSGVSTISGVSINSGHVSNALSVGSTNLNVSGFSTFNGSVLFQGATDTISWNKASNRMLVDEGSDIAFGDSAELAIRHSNDVSLITESRAGVGATLSIQADKLFLRNKDGNENYLEATDNGSVKIYYDFASKLETIQEGIQVTGIASAGQFTGNVNAGVATITSKLDLGGVSSQGISTSSPQSELHVFNSGISSVLIESGSNESVITLGRNTNGQTSGAIRYGNKSAGFPYSNEDALDIINYDVGNVNFYLSGGNTAGTGDFHWNYRSNNTRLMTLTNDGKLGIGVTTPINPLHVVGIATFGSNSFFGNNLEIGNNLTVKNNLTVDGSFNSDVTGNLTGNVTGNINSVGFSTLYDAQVTRFLGIGVLASTGVPFKVNAASSAQFSIDSLGEVKVGHDLIVTDSFAVGSTSASSGVDFKTAGAAAKRFMIPPKVDNAGRGNLTGLVAGALIYNTSTNKLNVYNGTAWRQVTDGAV